MMDYCAPCFVLLVCLTSPIVVGLRCYECSEDKPENCQVSDENRQSGFVREVECGSNGSCAVIWAFSPKENKVRVDTLACYSPCSESPSCNWRCVTCCDSDYCNGPPYAERVSSTSPNATLAAGRVSTTKATVVFRCPEGLFKCQSQEACLEQSAVCDGSSDCEDDSDEMNCSSRSPLTVSTPRTIHPTQLQATDEPPNSYVCPSTGMFLCNSDSVCIDGISVCDGQKDCSDASDEMHCKTNCTLSDFKCSDVCVPASTVRCNGVVQCSGGVDELGCTAPCASDLFQCHDLICVLAVHRCDGIPQCGDYSDETNCASNCSDGEFLCDNGHCVGSVVVCDSGNNCWDWSDERNCAPCYSGSLRCWDSVQDDKCYLQAERCDGHFNCKRGKDEESCGGCHLDQFRCDVTVIDGSRCYDTGQLCDGHIDCDQSFIDEFNDVCPNLYQTCAYGQGLFPCLARDGLGSMAPHCYNASQRCDGVANCRPSATDESGCSNSCDQYCIDTFLCWDESERCNGKFFCSDYSDEEDCGSCFLDEFPCPSGQECFRKSDVCDGYRDCMDGFDEQDCTDKINYNFPSASGQPIYPSPVVIVDWDGRNEYSGSRSTIGIVSGSMSLTVMFVIIAAYGCRRRFRQRRLVAATNRNASHLLPPPYSEVDPEGVYFNNRPQTREQLTFLGLPPREEEEELPSYEEATLLAEGNRVIEREQSEQEVNEPGDESHNLLSGSREESTGDIRVQGNPMDTVL